MALAAILSSISLYVIFAAGGFFAQSILPSSKRFIVYPASFILGLVTGWQSNYFTLSLGAGMIGRAVAGGYWHCVVLEAVCLVTGILIGVYAI
jgi:hypothetical protein